MNSLDYSQTNNIQNIIDEIEERTNLTVPSAVLIPLKQHRTVNLSANDTFEIDVELVTRKKIFKKISKKVLTFFWVSYIIHFVVRHWAIAKR